MRPGARRGASESSAERLLPLLLVPVALLSNLAAALPNLVYYLPGVSASYMPLRLAAARELAEGRLLFWNPWSFEGTFAIPSLYPADLLHALWPSPVFVSWLLTLHLPLAALAAFWLARELEVPEGGAFLAGGTYALGGFSLSSLSHGTLLQALALTPFAAGLLRRAARDGGRAVPLAAIVVALMLAAQAPGFTLQAVLLGVALGLEASPAREGLGRVASAAALGLGIAALPIVTVLALVPEAAPVPGLDPARLLGQALHPAVLAQALLAGLFGSAPDAPSWGGRFFGPGGREIASVYLGPAALAFAGLGVVEAPRRLRLLLVAALGLGVAAATTGLGARALLLPHLALALLAGFAVLRLQYGRGFGALAAGGGVLAVLALALVAALTAAPAGLVAWSGVEAPQWPQLQHAVRRDAGLAVLVALALTGLWAASRRLLTPPRALGLAILVCLLDLARAGAGLTPQEEASFYEPLPEMAALRLATLDGGRVFSYGVDDSQAYRELAAAANPAPGLTRLFLRRQALVPDASVLDRVESAQAGEPAPLLPRPRELKAALDPGRVGELLPWLRNAGVARVLSLDPLHHPELVPLATVAAGPPGVAIHAYGFDSWPRASLACRATPVASREQALLSPYRAGFDPWREVALEEQGGGPDDALPATCTKGRARRTWSTAGEEHYEVNTNASAYLVVRASHARGWRALVDGVPAPVLRANGKHRAVAVSAGRHEVVLRYTAPGLLAGAVLSAASLGLAALLLVLGGRGR